ncbi:MAG: hypothetical protein LC715_02970 [Gammaproteobacteria bacterium]|nr:hypothetical protein [Gammaproteobacteria bacterium]
MIAALAAGGVLAALAVLSSELPRVFAWPLSVGAWCYGTWLSRREARTPAQHFVWSVGQVTRDGEQILEVAVQWRGPLAFVRWRDDVGRLHHRSWWPDTLPAAQRRELRLAAGDAQAVPGSPSMAP